MAYKKATKKKSDGIKLSNVKVDNKAFKQTIAFLEIESLAKTCYNDQELGEKVRAIIKRVNIPEPKRVGVICCTMEDFRHWKEDQGFTNITKHYNQNRFEVDNTIYICINNENSLRGHRFDGIVETTRAYENKEYDQIKQLANLYCLSK